MADLAKVYAGLSDQARSQCFERMSKTLARKPKSKKTRSYVNSLTGETETPAQFWERCQAAATKAATLPTSVEMDAVHKPRKDRLSPFARRAHAARNPWNCRGADRYHSDWSGGVRHALDMVKSRLLRESLCNAQEGICAFCGKPMGHDASCHSLDHVIPVALGGDNGVGNYVLCHSECNRRKANDVPTGCEMVWLLAVNARIGALPVVF